MKGFLKCRKIFPAFLADMLVSFHLHCNTIQDEKGEGVGG